MDLHIKGFIEYLFPVLLVTWAVSRGAHLAGVFKQNTRTINLIIVLVSVVIALCPFTGLSPAEYLLSINPNFSIGSIAILFIFLWKEFGGRALVSDRDVLWFSIYNLVVSLCLFASSLGFVRFDLYYQGYGFSMWFVLTAILTIILFLIRNPLAYIFIAYIAAFDLKLLPSGNLFDYMTDGFLLFISLGLVVFPRSFRVSRPASHMPSTP